MIVNDPLFVCLFISLGRSAKNERLARARGDEVMEYYHCAKKQSYLLAFDHVRRCLRTEAQLEAWKGGAS